MGGHAFHPPPASSSPPTPWRSGAPALVPARWPVWRGHGPKGGWDRSRLTPKARQHGILWAVDHSPALCCGRAVALVESATTCPMWVAATTHISASINLGPWLPGLQVSGGQGVHSHRHSSSFPNRTILPPNLGWYCFFYHEHS